MSAPESLSTDQFFPYFHGTTATAAQNITTNGLRSGLHLTPDVTEAREYGSNIVKVMVPRNLDVRDSEEEGGWDGDAVFDPNHRDTSIIINNPSRVRVHPEVRSEAGWKGEQGNLNDVPHHHPDCEHCRMVESLSGIKR